MDCDTCFEKTVKLLPKIKYYSFLDDVSYTLRNWYHKKRNMIRSRIEKLQNLSVKTKFNPYYISQIEKDLYGGKKIKIPKSRFCYKCNQDIRETMMIYIKHQIITKIFDFFGTNRHLLSDEDKEIVKKHLIKNKGINICQEWKGINYYHLEILGFPMY